MFVPVTVKSAIDAELQKLCDWETGEGIFSKIYPKSFKDVPIFNSSKTIDGVVVT